MYLAPVSGPLSVRRSRAGLERPFGQPGRASEHARTAAPFTGATAQKKSRCRRVGDERGASLAAGARAGAEVFEKPSGDGDDDDDGDDARSGVSVRSCLSISRRPSSALTGPRPAPRESAEGVGPVAGSVGYHRFARARTTGRGPGRARASLALAANTAGPSCYTAPGRLDDHPPPLFEDDWRERSRVRRGLCEARRALW